MADATVSGRHGSGVRMLWRGSSGGAFTGALSPAFLLFRREALGSCASSGGFRLLGGLGILLGLVPGSSFSRWGGVGARGASRYRARAEGGKPLEDDVADAACGLGVRTSGGGSSVGVPRFRIVPLVGVAYPRNP